MHADQIPADREVAANIRSAGQAGVITDAIINPLTTTAGLRTALTGATTHADQKPVLERYGRAVDAGVALATLSDAGVAAANTVEGTADLGENGDSDAVYHVFLD
jgi:hypothetical protein